MSQTFIVDGIKPEDVISFESVIEEYICKAEIRVRYSWTYKGENNLGRQK